MIQGLSVDQIFTVVIIAELVAKLVMGLWIGERLYTGAHGLTLDLLSVLIIISSVSSRKVLQMVALTAFLPAAGSVAAYSLNPSVKS